MPHIKQVKVNTLCEGLYILDLQAGQALRPPIYSVEGLILHESDVDIIKSQGFQFAYIDLDRCLTQPKQDLEINPEKAARTPMKQSVDFQEEFIKGQKLYADSLLLAKSLFEAITTPEASAVMNIAPVQAKLAEIMQSLVRNKNALLSIAKLKNADEYTYTHSLNVAMLAVIFGKKLNIHEDMLTNLGLAGFFHDIGKLFVPTEILNSPNKLSHMQRVVMNQHPHLGQTFLENFPQLPYIAKLGAIDHHERYDGSGYPSAKKGDEISLVGRVLALVDIYDALTSKRPYKDPMPPASALSIMYKTKDADFTPGFMEALISALGVYPPGSKVKLSSNYYAVVIEHNEEFPLKPKLITLIDSFGSKIAVPKILDLTIHQNITIVEAVVNLPLDINIEDTILYAK